MVKVKMCRVFVE